MFHTVNIKNNFIYRVIFQEFSRNSSISPGWPYSIKTLKLFWIFQGLKTTMSDISSAIVLPSGLIPQQKPTFSAPLFWNFEPKSRSPRFVPRGFLGYLPAVYYAGCVRGKTVPIVGPFLRLYPKRLSSNPCFAVGKSYPLLSRSNCEEIVCARHNPFPPPEEFGNRTRGLFSTVSFVRRLGRFSRLALVLPKRYCIIFVNS